MLLFTECAKKFIPDIDEVELDWQFRVNECDFFKKWALLSRWGPAGYIQKGDL